MSLDLNQIRAYIVTPALAAIGLGGNSADNLIMGTGKIESDWAYVKQIKGPAVSLMQIEPATHTDLSTRLRTLAPYKTLHELVLKELQLSELPSSPEFLIYNLKAAVIFARLKYRMRHSEEPELPAANDFEKLAALHKTVYNTSGGDTDLQRSTKIFRSIVYGYAYHDK